MVPLCCGSMLRIGRWVLSSDDALLSYAARRLTYGLSIRSNDCRFCFSDGTFSSRVGSESEILPTLGWRSENTARKPTVTLSVLSTEVAFRKPRASKPDLCQQLPVACPALIVQIYVSIARYLATWAESGKCTDLAALRILDCRKRKAASRVLQ